MRGVLNIHKQKSACVMAIPDDISLLASYPNSGDEFHCTLYYLGTEDEVPHYKDASEMLENVTRIILENEIREPIKAKIVGIKGFTTKSNGIAVVLMLKSDVLDYINDKIDDWMELNGFKSTTEHDYKPHITLGYVDNLGDIPEFKGPFDVYFSSIICSISGKRDEFVIDVEGSKVNNPIDTDPDPSPKPGARRLRHYWTRGEGAAKIGWGLPGDFNRCVRQLRKYVTDPKGLCNVYHRSALGAAPGHGHPGGKSDEISDDLLETLIFAESLKQLDCSNLLQLLNQEENKGIMPPELEHKNISVVSSGATETKDDGVVEALVSVTGILDNVGDIIVPGAYEKTLQTRTPKGVWSHDWNTPVSKVLDIKELLPGDESLPKTLANGEPWPAEAGALYVKLQFNLNTQRGRDAYEDVKFFDKDTEWSIGYKVPKGGASRDEKSNIRYIKTLDLFEFSPVLFGAASNARSLISAVKSLYDTDQEFLDEVKSVVTTEVVTTNEESKNEESVVRNLPVEVELTASSVEQIKALYDQLTAVLEIINNGNVIQPKTVYEFDDSKTLEEAIEDTKSAIYDEDIVQDLVNCSMDFVKVLKDGDVKNIKDTADDLLDGISEVLADSDASEDTINRYKTLVASVGHEIKALEVKTEEPVVENKTVSISNEELNRLLEL